jgi:NADH-quinone oxidoreductase subunit G
VWFLQQTQSICTGCARGCNINIHHHDGRVYRFKPRRNDAVNETWMCDEGRFSYKAINAETRLLHPQVRQGEQLVRATWADALQQAATLLQRHGSDAVGVLVAPQGTNEDCYLLARFVAEVCPTPHVVLFPGAPGYEDNLLLRADKNPNTRGAQDMGLPAPDMAPQLAALAQAIEQGTIKVLYVIDTDLPSAFGSDTAARLAAQLDGIILQTAHRRAAGEQATVILPGVTYAERDGTFTNLQGHLQRINAALRPCGEAWPAWQIYTALAKNCGHGWSYAAAEAVLADIASTIPGYQGVSYAKIGDLGYALTH